MNTAKLTKIKRKMWDALYKEEDELEKQYVGTDKNDDWFMVYRPWLQRGFEIALSALTDEEEEPEEEET